MNTTWILVADNAEASIHELGSRWDDLDCIAHYSNPAAGCRDCNGDEHSGDDQLAVQRPSSDDTRSEFAGMLAAHLRQGRVTHSYDDLVLVAPPAMLGELHEAIDETTRACVSNEFDKNAPPLSSAELGKYLCEALTP